MTEYLTNLMSLLNYYFSLRYVQTSESFVENAMHLQRLARAAMLYSSEQQWKCFPSPLFVGDRPLAVPLPITSNALVATSALELTTTVSFIFHDII